MTIAEKYADDHPATLEEMRVLASQGWEAHDFEETRCMLDCEQAPNSKCVQGERAAMALNSKTTEELEALVARWDNEAGTLIMDTLEAAKESLELRLRLVDCAYARVLVAGSILLEDGNA